MNPLEILFENDEIRIINKPYGLASQGGEQIKNSVDSLLEKQIGEKCFLVHRLDKETAGLLITAKSSKSAAKWTNLIGTKKVRKTYHAFVFGTMTKNSGTIHQIIEEKSLKKDAITHFKVLQVFENDSSPEKDKNSGQNCTVGKNYATEKVEKVATEKISLLELTLETGRMHQIRKHLASQNCPIINDDKYGDFKKNKSFQKKTGIKKMMLFAKKLELPVQEQVQDKKSPCKQAQPEMTQPEMTQPEIAQPVQDKKLPPNTIIKCNAQNNTLTIEIPYASHFLTLLEYFSSKC